MEVSIAPMVYVTAVIVYGAVRRRVCVLISVFTSSVALAMTALALGFVALIVRLTELRRKLRRR